MLKSILCDIHFSFWETSQRWIGHSSTCGSLRGNRGFHHPSLRPPVPTLIVVSKHCFCSCQPPEFFHWLVTSIISITDAKPSSVHNPTFVWLSLTLSDQICERTLVLPSASSKNMHHSLAILFVHISLSIQAAALALVSSSSTHSINRLKKKKRNTHCVGALAPSTCARLATSGGDAMRYRARHTASVCVPLWHAFYLCFVFVSSWSPRFPRCFSPVSHPSMVHSTSEAKN